MVYKKLIGQKWAIKLMNVLTDDLLLTVGGEMTLE